MGSTTSKLIETNKYRGGGMRISKIEEVEKKSNLFMRRTQSVINEPKPFSKRRKERMLAQKNTLDFLSSGKLMSTLSKAVSNLPSGRISRLRSSNLHTVEE